MGLSKVWVVAEASDGAPTSTTLEMLTKARELGDSVEAVIGGDGAAVADALGAHGATTVHATGDLGDGLPGVSVAAAIAAAVQGGAGPDLILLPTSYDGRDVAGRLSVKLDRTVITNCVDVELDGDVAVGVEPVFGGTTEVRTKFTGEGPQLLLVRPKSFAAEESGGGAAAVADLAVPDTGATGTAKVTARHVEETEGPKLDEADIVVAGGRGLGEAEKFDMVETVAKALGAAPGASEPSSMPAGFPTATRSVRPARWSSPRCTSPPASPVPPSTWWG